MTKLFYLIVILAFISSAHIFAQQKLDDGVLYGTDLTAGLTETKLAKLAESSKDQTVLVSGTISEVCQEMGCWLVVTDGTNIVRVITKHKFFMPKDCSGKTAVIEGKFKVNELSVDEQMHYYEETGKKPEKPITETKKEYTIEATGVKLLY